MKHITKVLLIAIVLLARQASHADDKIIAVDPASSLITIDQNGRTKVYRTKDFTEVTVNGVKTSLDDLRPGMTVTTTLSDTQTVAKIFARGLVSAQPLTNATKPSAPFAKPDSLPPTRQISIKMRVEGAERILFKDGKLWIERVTLGIPKPNAITINGVDWNPTWNGNATEPFTAFNPPLVPVGQSRVSLKQFSGRTKAVMEKPASSKFEKIPSVLIQDRMAGADFYEIQLSW